MKKILFLMLATFALASCNDDCDHNYSGGGGNPPTADIVGSWYEEEENEEMRFSSSGTWYDKYCNTIRSFETEGRYELSSDGRKLTYNYTFMGQMQFADWTISNRDELSFTITSDKVGTHVLEKIVETYNMAVGKTQQISFAAEHPNYTVQSYKSNNERIASVSESGLITTNGEKGTAYIKITTNNGNAWAKVVVGDECLDLWYDYISLIGKNYTQARAVLGNPHQNDGDNGFFYAMDFHDTVKQVGLWFDPDTRIVEQFQLLLKEGVPSEVVMTYMESKYYKFKEIGSSVQFLNNSTLDNSVAIIEYNQDTKTIIIVDIRKYYNLWPDFAKFINKTRLSMAEMMDGKEPTQQFMNICKYEFADNPFISEVQFQFVTKKVVKNGIHGIIVDVRKDADKNRIAQYLGFIYTAMSSSGTAMSFRSKDNLIDIGYNLEENHIYYTPVGTITDAESDPYPQLWVDYTKYFGLTHDEILAIMGEPLIDNISVVAYPVVNDLVASVYFYFDENTKKMFGMYVNGRDNVDNQEIIDALNKRYYSEGTQENNGTTYYKWRNAEDESKATIKLNFNPERKRITYQVL